MLHPSLQGSSEYRLLGTTTNHTTAGLSRACHYYELPIIELREHVYCQIGDALVEDHQEGAAGTPH